MVLIEIVIIIQEVWAIDEYAIKDRIINWLKPQMPLIKILIEANINIWFLYESIIRTINGPNFCKVIKIKEFIQFNDIITEGIHWKKGKIPNFITNPINISASFLFTLNKTDMKYSEDPAAWTIKYFIIPSEDNEFIDSNGINPNKDISKAIQVKNQFSLLMIINRDNNTKLI